MPPALALALLLASAPAPSDSPVAPSPVPSDSPVAPSPVLSDSPVAPSPVPSDSPSSAPFTALVLRAEGPGLADLGDALALRLPELPVVAESPAGGAPFVFVAVRTDAAVLVRHQVGVITSDGRAYFREVDTGADPPARVLASVIANLLRSIAQGTVRPDRTDVAIPPPDADPLAVPPVPEDSSSKPVPEDRPPDPTPKAAPTPAQPRWQFAPVLVAGAGLGVGPPQFGRTLTGGGGSLGLDARAPNGALVGLELRAIGQRAEGHGLARLRVAVLAGYALRRGRLELPVALGLTVEPWWVSPATAVADTRGARPLLGALLRVAPGVHFTFPKGRAALRGLRVGPRLELAGSFLVDDGAKVGGVSLQTASGTRELFRVGGLELHLGLELALWFGR